MLLQVIIWGEYQRAEKNRISICGEKEDFFYEQIKGELVHYKEINCLREWQEMMIGRRPVILCTNHLEDYEQLKQAAGRNKNHLLFIPQMQELEIDTILSLGIQAINEEDSISLGGRGKTVGEMIIEMLKNFHLMSGMNSYELILKVKASSMISSLAEVEDVLREYIPDKSELLITPWDEKELREDDLFYLLKGKKAD